MKRPKLFFIRSQKHVKNKLNKKKKRQITGNKICAMSTALATADLKCCFYNFTIL